jgi:UDP-glucose 4-epimerase
MKVLVTGALGFIGSNITERLVKEGHEVFALDNMHTGNESNVEKVKDRIKIFKMNSGDLDKIGEKFDVILHDGIYSSSPMYKKDPPLFAKAIGEWISVLEYARKNDSRVVFASTSSLYNGIKPPHKEDSHPFIMDFYSEARYTMERLAKLYTDFYSMTVTGLRYFSVYGPHEKAKGDYANLVTQFLWKMKAGERPVIFGDGTQTRDFIYVDDVVEANMLLVSHAKPGIFNVGTGRNTSLKEVVGILNQKLGASIEPKYEPNTIKNYVQHTLADTSKAEKELGFRARISLEDGIGRLIKHY